MNPLIMQQLAADHINEMIAKADDRRQARQARRGQRDALAALGGHLHHRGAAAAAPGASLRRPQALAGLVLEAEPGPQVRRRPFMTG
jgi:hypothetical protein